eukprot:scaffold8633_cov106-Cylindrotheca_fusiformis.AAC.1
MDSIVTVSTEQGNAWVIDSAISESKLEFIDTFRQSLTLNSKRPTVDRRFFADDPNTRPIAKFLEEALEKAIGKTVHVFRYQRFLEYRKAGSCLDPHTDGTKVCDDTKVTSTHTLLMYLTDCETGGETMLLQQGSWDSPILYSTKPRRGRILLFPHACPHAGNIVADVPKICLRAEVSLDKSKDSIQ